MLSKSYYNLLIQKKTGHFLYGAVFQTRTVKYFELRFLKLCITLIVSFLLTVGQKKSVDDFFASIASNKTELSKLEHFEE